MTIKHIFITAALSICLLLSSKDAPCNETYYIDDSPLMLYKTINWWYDCLPKDDTKLCGRPIRCTNKGNAQITYDESNKKIEIDIRSGFATMLLAFKRCRQCYGPSHLYPSWLDPDYFKDIAVAVIVDDASTDSEEPGTIKGFRFSNVKKEQARRIQKIGPDLQFVLEGVIGGLSNDRIALHASGILLKSCNRGSRRYDERYPIAIKIVNTITNDILAVFQMSWEPKP